MNTLIQFCYETGDSSRGCQYWQDFVVVEDAKVDVVTLEDVASNFVNNKDSDMEYEDITEMVMNTYFESSWRWLDTSGILVHNVHTVWV